MAIDEPKGVSAGPGRGRAVERPPGPVSLMDAGAVVSAYLVLASIRLGVGAPVAARMLLNIGVDAVVGLIPLLGDLFDIGWKANRRNLKLLEQWRLAPHRTRRRSALLLGAVTAGLLGTVIGVIWAAVAVFQGVVRWLGGSAAPLP